MAFMTSSINLLKLSTPRKKATSWLDPVKLEQERRAAQAITNRQIEEWLNPVRQWEHLVDSYDPHIVDLLSVLSARYIPCKDYTIESSGTNTDDLKQQFAWALELGGMNIQRASGHDQPFTFSAQWTVKASTPSKGDDFIYHPQFFSISVKCAVPRSGLFEIGCPTTIGTITVNTWLDNLAVFNSVDCAEIDLENMKAVIIKAIIGDKIGVIARHRKGLFGQIWYMSTPQGDLEIR
jgi:hypothetical protein